MQVKKNKTNKNSDQQVLKPNNVAVFTYVFFQSLPPSQGLFYTLQETLQSRVQLFQTSTEHTNLRKSLLIFSNLCIFSIWTLESKV